MRWTDNKKIFDKFLKHRDLYLRLYSGIDRFLYHETRHDTFETGKIYSYRYGAHWQLDNEKFKYRPNYSVALFHQKPEIHDCLDHKIIKDNWI